MTQPAGSARAPRWLLVLLAAVVALSLIGAGGALAVIAGIGDRTTPTNASVDAGFARDMSTHHRQAVTMAGIVRDRTDDSAVELLAYDIETGQNNQIGLMQGWLQVWGLPVNSSAAQMAWMSGGHGGSMLTADGLMPGMATSAEVDELTTLSGNDLNVRFLQLMTRHHEGGLPMAQYAVQHASTDVVRRLAQKVLETQTAEIQAMQDMLRERGATALPPP